MASSKSRIVYESVVLSTINVVPGATAERPNRVTFNGGIQHKAEYTTATFLLNVKQIGDVGNGIKRKFEADTITVEEAQSIINGAGGQGSGIPFFCIHGFGVETGSHLQMCQGHSSKFDQGKFFLVPVIWPTAGDLRNKTGTTPGSEKAFDSLKKVIDEFSSKSLMAHSIGNFVLRSLADAKIQFDNVFMLTADVRHDIFHEKRITSRQRGAEDGLKIFQMLSETSEGMKKGKIYVFANGRDMALAFSSWLVHWKTRLGQVGNARRKRILGLGFKTERGSLTHPDIRGSIENVFVTSKLKSSFDHSYYFDDFAIKFYQEKYFEIDLDVEDDDESFEGSYSYV